MLILVVVVVVVQGDDQPLLPIFPSYPTPCLTFGTLAHYLDNPPPYKKEQKSVEENTAKINVMKSYPNAYKLCYEICIPSCVLRRIHFVYPNNWRKWFGGKTNFRNFRSKF